MSHERIHFQITGAAPLVCHNGQLADPLNHFSKELKRVSGKRKKTEADYAEMARIEFLGGLYLVGGEPCIPGEVLEAAFIVSAKKVRMGPQAKAGVISDGMFAIEYDGPRTPEALWADERFRLVKAVKVQQNRIMRTRPIFRDWSAHVSFDYLPSMLNRTDVIETVERMGTEVGIGDWRPRFGRFQVEVVS